MTVLINWITVALSTIILGASIHKIAKGRFVMLHFITIVFYLMQVVPLIVDNIIGVDISLKKYPKMYTAMTDDTVAYIYCAFVIITLLVLYCFANRSLKNSNTVNFPVVEFNVSIYVKMILFFGMFLPILAVLQSPDPSIYLKFSYFYMNSYNSSSSEYLYHTSTITLVNYIAFASAMLSYLFKRKNAMSIEIYLAILLYVWIDGKRALLTFSLIGILIIDLLKKKYRSRAIVYFQKVIFFAVLIIGYFILYSSVTGKGSDETFYVQYSTYYGRMSNVKTAIYDVLNTNSILDYKGQTLLYNLLFFVPRVFWPGKPAMYCKYFTAYVYNRSSSLFLPWNLQVNVWSEFISNCGLWGIILAIALIIIVSRISEKSGDFFQYMFGTLFISFYCMFGFETLTLISYIIWLFCMARGFIFGKPIKSGGIRK